MYAESADSPGPPSLANLTEEFTLKYERKDLKTLEPLLARMITLIKNSLLPKMGASITTYTVLEVPYCIYSMIYPQTPF